jgi:hypothetical protein
MASHPYPRPKNTDYDVSFGWWENLRLKGGGGAHCLMLPEDWFDLDECAKFCLQLLQHIIRAHSLRAHISGRRNENAQRLQTLICWLPDSAFIVEGILQARVVHFPN